MLNHSGYEILRLCDGTHTLTEIIPRLGNPISGCQVDLVARGFGIY